MVTKPNSYRDGVLIRFTNELRLCLAVGKPHRALKCSLTNLGYLSVSHLGFIQWTNYVLHTTRDIGDSFQTLTCMVSSLSRRKLTPFSSYIFKQWGHWQSLALQPLLKKNGPTGSGLGPSATSSRVLKQLGPLDVAFWRWWRVEVCFCSVIVPSSQSTTHSPEISAFEGSAWATIGVTFSCLVPLR
jgi:hypothetical protein